MAVAFRSVDMHGATGTNHDPLMADSTKLEFAQYATTSIIYSPRYRSSIH